MKLSENKEVRLDVWRGLLRDDVETPTGQVRQHELMPCVRRGVAQRLAAKAGYKTASRKSALYFLRGNSAEAAIKDANGLRTVYKGVTCSTDWWTGGEYSFIEIKSTMMSSTAFWKTLETGNVDLLNPDPKEPYPKFSSWFKQCAIYCIAFGVTKCRLLVFFMHGDYAERRRKCPDCGSDDLQDGRLYKLCSDCGYKSYRMDLRVYNLDFDPEELVELEKEVFDVRRKQFMESWALSEITDDPASALSAPATPSFFCGDCKPGKFVKCEWYGESIN